MALSVSPSLASALASADALFAADSAAVSVVFDLRLMGGASDLWMPFAAVFRSTMDWGDRASSGRAYHLGDYPSDAAANSALSRYHAWARNGGDL